QGDHLGLLINHRYLYEKPSSDAMVVADLSKIDERAGPDSFAVQRLHACAGSWLEVEGHLFSRHHRGWTRGTCSNQVATCPEREKWGRFSRRIRLSSRPPWIFGLHGDYIRGPAAIARRDDRQGLIERHAWRTVGKRRGRAIIGPLP